MMARQRYTIEQVDFLKEHRLIPLKELTCLFNARFSTNKPMCCIQAVFKNRGIRRGRKSPGKGNGTLLAYTPEKLAWLRENYLLMSVKELAEAFNALFKTSHTIDAIKATLSRNNMTSGRTGRFEKGLLPWNTGTKGVMKPNCGNFRPGNEPSNRKPLGTERICSKDGFILIKVAETDPHNGFPTRYRHKHAWIWEQTHGPVPKGYVVAFRDGNKLHCEIENLMLVTRSELLCLNLHNYKTTPAELKPSVLALARVEAEAGIRTRPGRGRKTQETI